MAIAPLSYAQDAPTATTTAEEAEVTKGVFDKTWSITPRLGVLGVQDGSANYVGRSVGGFTTNIDLSNSVQLPNRLFGIETGFMYSHIGAPDSGFFGTSDTGNAGGGTNSFLVPFHATLGTKPTDSSLVALSLGTTLVYRSIGSGMLLGRSGDTDTGSHTDFFPSVALTAGWALSNTVGLSLRGDYIPTPSDDLFAATLGATIGLT